MKKLYFEIAIPLKIMAMQTLISETMEAIMGQIAQSLPQGVETECCRLLYGYRFAEGTPRYEPIALFTGMASLRQPEFDNAIASTLAQIKGVDGVNSEKKFDIFIDFDRNLMPSGTI